MLTEVHPPVAPHQHGHGGHVWAHLRRFAVRALTFLAIGSGGYAQAQSSAPVSFSPVAPPVSCVEPVQPSLLASKSSVGPVRVLGLTGAVYTADFAGNYDRGQTAARAALATSLLEATGQDVDFVVVFTDFEFATGQALAFYSAVRNEVQGIGQQLFDHSLLFGSPGRLQGYVDMAALSRYRFNTRDPAYRVLLNTLSHELMHRWGVGVRFQSSQGQLSSDLLGRDGSHWSLLADTNASVMYGGAWRQDADGSFRLTEALERFSRWDLYLAGWAAPEEVPPLRLLRNTGLDPAELPQVGMRAVGTAEQITLAQVIAAEGARTPSAAASQREFTAALVLLVRPGQSIEEAKLAQLQRFAQRYESYFQSITEGRASLRFIGDRPGEVRIGAPEALSGSPPQRHADPVAAALNWLKAIRQPTGGFADRPSTAVRDSVAALRTILQVDPGWAGAAEVREFLSAAEEINADDRLRRASVHASSEPQRPAPAIVDGWADGVLDLALSAALDADSVLFDAGARAALLSSLVGHQSTQGSFASVSNGAARLRSSLLAARALLVHWPEGHEGAERARVWLLEHLLELPLQGARSAGTSELADALVLAGELRLPESLKLRLRAALESRQGRDGDWEGSVYTTAVAGLALARLGQPDLEVVSVSVVPEAPRAGEPVVLRARVRNAGGLATPELSYLWSQERGSQPGTFDPLLTRTLPSLIPGEAATVEALIETGSWPALVRLRLQLDPESALVEVSEDNNQADLSIQFAAPGSGADPALVLGEHVFDPDRFQRLGDRITLSGQVRNFGAASAQQVLLRLERVLIQSRQTLAETRVDVPANGRIAYSLGFDVSRTGEHALELVLDPLQEAEDSHRGNNALHLQLPASPGIDLALMVESLDLNPVVPRVGLDQRVRVNSINLGNSHSGQASIELRRLDANGWVLLQRRPLQAEAGAEVETEFVWRPQDAGTQRLQIMIDPDQQIDEIARDNNSFEFDVEPIRSEGADLVVVPGSTEATPAQPLQGRPLQVSAQLLNQGAAATGPFAVSLFLGDPRSGGQPLAATTVLGLDPGSDTTVVLEIPSFPARGDVSLFLMADSDLVIAELDESNNFGIVDAIARAMADVGASAQSVLMQPEQPLPGMPVILRVALSNRGEQSSEPLRTHLFEVHQGGLHAVSPALDVPALAPGARFEASWQWTARAEGAESLLFQIDPEQSAVDGDRSNNEIQLPLAANIEGALALTPYFSPNGDGVRDRALVVLAGASIPLVRADVRNVEDRLIARIEAFEDLPGGRKLLVWDGLDQRGEIAPDGEYVVVAVGAAERSLGVVRVVLDNDQPMALASVLSGDVVSRRLPNSINEWLVPVAGSPVEDYLYTWGSSANSAAAMKRGIARTHAYMGGVESVLSARWLERHAGNGEVTSLLIEPTQGRELFFTAGAKLWVQDAGTLDQARLVADLPAGQHSQRLVGTAGPRHVLLQSNYGVMLRVGLDGGVVQTLSVNTDERFLSGYASGVLVGKDAVIEGGILPSRFLPFDGSLTPTELQLSYRDDLDCFARVHLVESEPVLFWHALRLEGEEVRWFNLRTGESRDLLSHPTGGCLARSKDPNSQRGFSQAHFQWIGSEAKGFLVDHASGLASLYSPQGTKLLEQPVPRPAIAGEYGELQGNSPNHVLRGEPLGFTALCPSRLFREWPKLARWGQGERNMFEPSARELYFSSGDVLLDADPGDAGSELGSGYSFVCEGAIDYLALSLGTGQIRRIAGQTAWPLLSPEDRQRYLLVAGSEGTASLPAAWPRFFQRAGAHLREDARISVQGAVGRPWARAAQLLASIHDESRLLLSDSGPDSVPRATQVISSLQRLRSDLRASSNGRSVTFTGYATDANLDYYQIDYASVGSPEEWLSLVPPRREQVRGDEFMTWAPPQSGAYVFRLRVVDRAGNRLDSFASAELVFASPISNARTDHRAISPNGDGSKDRLQVDFVVSRPTEIGFAILDDSGRTVFADFRTFGAADLGDQQWIWSGQSEQGAAVPDGVYRLELTAGFAFPVAVDNTFPLVDSVFLTSGYPPILEPGEGHGARVSGVQDRRGRIDITSELRVQLQHRREPSSQWLDHSADYVVAQAGASLRWIELFSGQYRWLLEDQAGNRLYREMPPISPVLAIVGAGVLGRPSAESWQQPPFQAATMREVPRTPPMLPQESAVPVFFMAHQELPKPVSLDIARTAGHADPISAPVIWQTQTEVLPLSLGGGLFQVEVDLSDVGADELVALRVRQRDPEGVRVSNAMRFEFRTPEDGNGNPTDPFGPSDLASAIKVWPDTRAVCGSDPSAAIRVRPVLNSRARSFRLELLDPRQLTPVVIASGAAEGVSLEGYRVETDGLPGVEGRLRLQVEDDRGRSFVANEHFPIDRTRPELGFSFPATGTRVCSIAGQGLGVDAFLNTESRALYALEAASLSSAEPRFTQVLCNGRKGASDGCALLDEPLGKGELTSASFSRRLLALPDPSVPEGPVSLRLRALDWSGAQSCATTTVHIDASVEVDSRREPLPESIGSQAPVISPQGDPEVRMVHWSFRAREPVSLRAEIFAVRALGSAANPRYQIDGPALATLREGAQPIGDFDIEWDARLQGQVAADAVYGMRLHARDECGHEREVDYFVRVDATPPALQLTSPVENAELRLASVQAVGTVQDADPGTWELAFSSAGAQGPWQQLAEGRGNVPTPRALGVLQTQGIVGPVWIQLSARDRVGNGSELVRAIRILPRPDVLTSARLSRSLISPNGDGRLDSLELRLLLARAALVDIDLLTSSGQLLERLAESQSINAGAFSLPWGGNIDASAVADGDYRLHIRARDAELGGEPHEAELDFVVDRQPPALAWSPELPAVLACELPPELMVSDPLLAEFQAELLAATGAVVRTLNGTVDGSYAFGGFAQLVEGSYRLNAVALDGAGNRSEAEAEFTLDCTPPEISLTSPEAESVLARGEGRQHRLQGRAQDANHGSVLLELVSESNPQERQVLLDLPQQTVAEFDSAWTAEVPDGAYRLHLTARDRAGNEAQLEVPVAVDGTPPVALIHSPDEGEVVTADLVLTVTATDTHFESWQLLTATPEQAARSEWSRLSQGDQAIDAANLSSVQGLPQGERLFRLEVQDRAGWMSRVERRWLIDAEAPPVPVDLSASLEAGRNARLAWRGGDAPDLAGFHVYRSGGDFEERITAEPVSARQYLDLDLPEGLWAYRVTAIDAVGNESVPSNQAHLRVDRTPPEVAVVQPADGERVRGQQVIRGTASSAEDFERYELALFDEAGSALQVLRESSVPVRAGQLGLWDSREVPEGARVRLRLRAWDRSGNVGEVTNVIKVDNLPPSAPQGLMGELQGADLELRWLPNPEPDLLGYLLYRNGRLLTGGATLPADLRPLALAQDHYLDPSVPDGEHVYRVYAIDSAGNLSPPSAPFTQLLDRGPPSAELVRPEDGLVFDQPIEVLAQTEHRDVAQIAFYVRGEGQSDWSPLGEAVRTPPWRQVFNPTGRPLGDYELRAVATDQGGLSDPQPPVVHVRHDDVTPPPAPSGLRALADGNEVRLSWLASTADDLAQYHVERFGAESGWIEIESVNAPSLATTDLGRSIGTYRYRVLASDASGNRSEPSEESEADVFSIDLHPLPHTPTAEAEAELKGTSPRVGEIQLWRQVEGETVELPGASVSVDRVISVQAPLLSGRNVVSAAVLDTIGHRSLRTHVPVTRGQMPGSPQALQGQVSADEVSLQWQSVSGAAGYRVYRNGAAVQSDVELAQHVSAWSNGIAVPEVTDGLPSTTWSEQPAALSDRLSRRLELRWESPQLVGGIELVWRDADHSARDFDVYGWYDERWNRLAEVRNQSGPSYQISFATAYPTQALMFAPLRGQWPGRAHALAEARVLSRSLVSLGEWSERPADGRHRYTVSAVSPLGFEGAPSSEWIAEIGDVVPPAAVVLGGVREGRDAVLSWTASDAADLRRYRLLRGDRLITEVDAGGERQYRDPNLPNGPHRYVIVVEDQAGNLSLPSNEVVIEVSGALPAAPTVTEARSQLDAPALELHWRAAEGSTPSRYRLFASTRADDPAEPFREIARPQASPWLHTGLSYGMRLYYRVQAEDASGNLSALSSPFEAWVRDLRTPAAPSITWPALAPAQLDVLQPRYRVCGVAEPGRRIELRVNGEERSGSVAEASTRMASTFRASGGLPADIAFSPDARRMAWLDQTGAVNERDLQTGQVRPLGVWMAGELRYGADAREFQGRYGDGQRWSVWSQEAGQVALDFGLDRVGLVAQIGREGAWLVYGSRMGQAGLWWIESEGADPQRIETPTAEALTELVVDARSASTFAVSETGRVLYWQVGAASAEWVSIDGDAVALRASPLGSGVLVWALASTGHDFWYVDAGSARRVLSIAGPVDDFVPSADGQGVWVLAERSLLRYAFDQSQPIEVVALDDGEPADRLLQSRTGTLAVVAPSASSLVQIVRTAGAWCGAELSAAPGLNEIVAIAANEAGVRSAPSAQLDLNFDSSIAQLPDLAVAAADIRLLPSPGVAGQPHSLLIEVRNVGFNHAWDFDVRISMTDPQGRNTSQVRRASLGPQEQALLSLPLGLLQSGQYRVQVELDSEGRIVELSEANNLAQADLRIHPDAEPQLNLSANASERPPGQPFEGSIGVSVARDFTGRLELWIADAGGDLVLALPGYETGPLSSLTPWSRPWTWVPAQGLLAGSYRLHARLLDTAGTARAEQSLDLSLQASLDIALSLQAASLELPLGQNLGVAIGLNVSHANAMVEGGRLELSLERADGSVQSLWSGSTGALGAGYRLRRSLSWATAGESPGEVRLRLSFSAPGMDRELFQSLRLLPDAALPDLFGELTLAPAASIALGQPAQLNYRVGNRGSATLSERPIRVRVQGAADPQTIVSDQRNVSLSPAQILNFELDLSALPQRPAQYAAVLETETDHGWRALAQLGLQSNDVEPPSGELLVPATGQPVRTPVYFEAAIRDRHSRVDFAEYSLNGAPWRALPGAGERYSSVLGALPDGEHQLALRAQDIWGNRWQMPPRIVLVDNTPPVLDIQGVADGEHYAAPVQPLFSAQDPHLAEVRGFDNSVLIESGAMVSAEGAHRLEVRAVDAAGNRAQRELSFVLDFTAPTIEFLAPLQGTQLSTPETTVELQTEADAHVELSVGSWQATAQANAQGRVLLTAVPLQVGLNRIEAEASDRAGNRSPRVSVQVTRLQLGGELVGQLDVPVAELPRGEALALQMTVHNQTAAAVAGHALLRAQSAGGDVLAESRRPIELLAGAQQTWSESLPTALWPLGVIGLQLVFDDGAEQTVLASAGLNLVDRLPPQVRVLQPGAGALMASPVALQVEASDDDALDQVSYRSAPGAWTSMTPGAPPLFGASLALPDGAHTLEARALDRSGNLATAAPVNIVVDSTPPEIVIEAVADQGLYGEPARPQVRMVDAHPGSLVVTLNDQLYVPGSLIDQSGRYRLSVRATDQLEQFSERQIEFEVDLEPVSLQVLSPDEGVILPSNRVSVLGLTKPNARVSAQGPLSQHEVQADATGGFRVDDVGLNAGLNTLTLRAVDMLGRPSNEVARSVRVDITGQQGLLGALDGVAEIPVGQTWAARAELRETLGQARDSLDMRVLIERPGQSPHELVWIASLAANGVASRELDPPVQSELGLVSLRLQARLDGAWVDLAQRSLAVVDRTPPELAYLDPAPDSYHRSDIELRAQASDAHSEVARVQARVGGGEWIKLQSASNGLWQGALQSLDEGRVSIEIRAQDTAQNWTPILSRSVIHDRTPPKLQITGVTEGGLYRERVQVEVSASDASPVDLRLQLNGAAFSSGQWVEAHGRYELVARATDAAGNVSTRTLEFELDLQPPEVTIVAPAAGALIRSEETPVLGHTEGAAEVLLRANGLERSLRADAKGQFRFDRVPLRIGANRLQVRSTDVAGNTGPWAEVQVERRGGFVLRGALQSPVDLSIGALLPIRIQVNNDAAHPQPSVQLRVLARDSRGIERALDVRTHSFTPGESLQYQVSPSTAEWPAGALNLRLLAADEVEVQLADARVELRGQPALPPPLPRPRPIPIDQPWMLAWLLLVLFAAAGAALRRRGRES